MRERKKSHIYWMHRFPIVIQFVFICGQELLLQPVSALINTHARTYTNTHGQDDCVFNGLGAGSDDFPRERWTVSRGGADCCSTTGRPAWHHCTRNAQLPPRPPPGKCSQPSGCMTQVCLKQNKAFHCICTQKPFGFMASCCCTTHHKLSTRCTQS